MPARGEEGSFYSSARMFGAGGATGAFPNGRGGTINAQGTVAPNPRFQMSSSAPMEVEISDIDKFSMLRNGFSATGATVPGSSADNLPAGEFLELPPASGCNPASGVTCNSSTCKVCRQGAQQLIPPCPAYAQGLACKDPNCAWCTQRRLPAAPEAWSKDDRKQHSRIHTDIVPPVIPLHNIPLCNPEATGKVCNSGYCQRCRQFEGRFKRPYTGGRESEQDDDGKDERRQGKRDKKKKFNNFITYGLGVLVLVLIMALLYKTEAHIKLGFGNKKE
jgi:hypothetical protein